MTVEEKWKVFLNGGAFTNLRKTTPTLGRNRVHNNGHSTVSSANLVTHEKVSGNGNGATVTSGNVSVLHMKHNGNITMASPIGNGGFQPSSLGSNMGLGASAILAASLERERERERQRENYAATVRSIVSRASANGQLYEEDEIENDSLCQSNSQSAESNKKKMAWEAPSTTASHQTGVTTISCANGSITNVGVNGSSNLLTATDTMGSSENNLTVYF